MCIKAGQIVKSVAGHDKNKFYVIVSAQENSVAIADGKARRLDKPKRKNILHVRPTNTVLDLSVLTTDKKLRKAIADFRGEGGY